MEARSPRWTKIFTLPSGKGNPIRIKYNTVYKTLFVGTDTVEVFAGYNPHPIGGMVWTPFFSFSSLGLGTAAITDIKFDPANIAVFISTSRTTTGRVVRLDYTVSGGFLKVRSARDITGNMTTGRSGSRVRRTDPRSCDPAWGAM